jgi:hypothetical protein
MVASPVRYPSNPTCSVAVSYALDTDSAIAVDAITRDSLVRHGHYPRLGLHKTYIRRDGLLRRNNL